MTAKRIVFVAALLLGAAGLIACSQQAPPQQSAAPAPPAQTSAAPAAAPSTAPITAAPTGLGSAQYNLDPDLRCDLMEVKRVSGNALIVRWRVVNTSTSKYIDYDFSWEDVYYIDPAENKKYGFLTDAEGNRILDIKWGRINAGQQWLAWAKFPAPPPTSTKVSISVGGFAPFEDVPVAQ